MWEPNYSLGQRQSRAVVLLPVEGRPGYYRVVQKHRARWLQVCDQETIYLGEFASGFDSEADIVKRFTGGLVSSIILREEGFSHVLGKHPT